MTDNNIEKYKAETQIKIEEAKLEHMANIEMFKSVLQAGQNAIKASFIINGGASIAMLAFISNLIVNSKTEQIIILANSLIFFVAGVFVVAISSGIRYVTQWFYANLFRITGHIFNITTILLVISSYWLFGCGMYKAYIGFIGFAEPTISH